jgi:signal transduction histidine kinase
VATLQPLADESGSVVTVESAEGGATVTSDRRLVHQIVLNLLSNAIKYGVGKPIRVVVGQDESRPSAGTVIDVVDQGPGLAPEEKERIFDEFEQVGQARDKPGTGLGLSISRQLAGTLGGSLDVESERGKGSTFRLWLPVRRPRGQSRH